MLYINKSFSTQSVVYYNGIIEQSYFVVIANLFKLSLENHNLYLLLTKKCYDIQYPLAIFMKSIKRIFKEKTSIKKELEKALETHTPLTPTILSKLVGISIYRVRKYCKTHSINLNDYSRETLAKKKISKIKEDSPKNKKIKMKEPPNNKIQLNEPHDIKIKI